MPAHGVRAASGKQVIIGTQQNLQDRSQSRLFIGFEAIEVVNLPPRQQQRLEGPNGPVRHHDGPMSIGGHNALTEALLFLDGVS